MVNTGSPPGRVASFKTVKAGSLHRSYDRVGDDALIRAAAAVDSVNFFTVRASNGDCAGYGKSTHETTAESTAFLQSTLSNAAD